MADSKQIECVARAMAKKRGFDPDGRAGYGKPLQIKDGYLAPSTTVAVWELFTRDAALAVDAIAAASPLPSASSQ